MANSGTELEHSLLALPYRGRFADARPPALSGLVLPPAPMPGRHRLRPLKAWRYVGVYGPELMACVCAVRIGRVRQSFWAVWDRANERFHERTAIGRRAVSLGPGGARVLDRTVRLELTLAESPGIETVCRSGHAYAWTRKQGDVPAHGTIELDGVRRPIRSRAVIDDTAAYYARHTTWRWSAGIGLARGGVPVAWNLVSGINDPPRGSERTVWVEGQPSEAEPSVFADDLSSVGALRFRAEAVRQRRDRLLLLESSYRQPFGTFSGVLPGGLELAEGYGVMEAHDVRW